MKKTATIPYRIGRRPGQHGTPSSVYQHRGVKNATGASLKIRGRDNITIGTWNTRSLRAAGKLQELTHKMDGYRWNVLGLCKMRSKNFGETTKEERRKVFFSGTEDKHEHGVGFLVIKDIVNTVMGCRPVSSRLFTIRLRAVPFNITIVQAYAPTSDYDDREITEFYDQVQNVIDQTPKKDILGVQGDWNAEVGRDACGNWRDACGPFFDDDNERGLRLLELATFNDLVLANTCGHHKASRKWTWHSPNGQRYNQIDYILVRKRFRSGVNIARTLSFLEADAGSDNDLLMMTFHLRLKRISKPKHTRLKFDLEKLKDPNVLETFQVITVGKLAPLTIMKSEDADMGSMIATFNTAVTETASEILGKHRQKNNNNNKQTTKNNNNNNNKNPKQQQQKLGHCRNS